MVQDGTSSLVYGLDLISSTDGAGNRTYFSYDGLGSTSDLTDAAGTVTDTYSYDVFGAVRARTGTNASPWKFTGEQEDGAAGDSGYYFLRARYYDPSTGRFASKDPIEFDQRYAYAGGNPVLASDPSGLDCGLGESDNCGGPKYGGGSSGYTGSPSAPRPSGGAPSRPIQSFDPRPQLKDLRLSDHAEGRMGRTRGVSTTDVDQALARGTRYYDAKYNNTKYVYRLGDGRTLQVSVENNGTVRTVITGTGDFSPGARLEGGASRYARIYDAFGGERLFNDFEGEGG